ncbi:MAG TPA: insulinase family protein, partial [Woeseiaceae bacterium]|nr:insulinase family protein [Woeseiaceae bacterium]
FQGTENREGEYFAPFTDAGATGMNGTTSEDRTNYYATVPTGALDMALWMESDRMRYLPGAMTPEVLDEQRGVVKNEKRQAETRPYAEMPDRIREGIYPVGHPYRHPVIGTMEDLDAASLENVREWFGRYYGASNAVLVLVGDVSLAAAKEKVSHYFAAVPPGEPLATPEKWIPELGGDRLERMYDEVGQARIARVWAMPGLNERDAALLYLANETLVGRKNAPLQKLLVDDLELATAAFAAPVAKLLSGEYQLYIDLKPGVAPEEILPHVDRVLARFLADGPDEQLLENAKLALNTAIMGGLERSSAIGTVLAEGWLYSADPLHINTELAWLNEATAADVQAAARRWLERAYYQLTVLPFPDYSAGPDPADRSEIPATSDVAAGISFPPIRAATLPNGLDLVVARRGSVPIVDVSIRIGAGQTAAPEDAHTLADFVFMLADKGTRGLDANELAAMRDRIAMSGRLSAGLEDSTYNYRILRSNLRESLEIALEILRHPTFPEDELAKLKVRIAGYLATLERAPANAAESLYERAVFGPGNPMAGVWTPESLESAGRDMLVAWHEAEVAPDAITIYMIGDIDFATAEAAVAATFGKWRGEARSGRRPVGDAGAPAPRVILVDQPGAASSTIVAGHALPPWNAEAAAVQVVMNRIFGGSFESRLNMNLREDKSWSYGYGSSIAATQTGDQLFVMSGQVQADRTALAMAEIESEFAAFAATKPPTETEVERAVANRILALPGEFETNRGFLAAIVAADAYGLPYDYAAGRADRYAAVTHAAVVAAARELFRPGELVWVVAGDLALIEDDILGQDFGPVEVWDAFGRRVR